MEDLRETTNFQDNNKVATHGSRRTPAEHIDTSQIWRISDVSTDLLGQASYHKSASGDGGNGRVQQASRSEYEVHRSPKPSTGDDLSLKEDDVSQVQSCVVSPTPQEGRGEKRGHVFQDFWKKPSLAEVPEEGSFHSSEEPNKVVTSQSLKPSTSEEETNEGESLKDKTVPYKIPPLHCPTCYNMISLVFQSYSTQPSPLLDLLPNVVLQWASVCPTCGEPFPALRIKDILAQNDVKKGSQRLDGKEGTDMDRDEVTIGERDGRDEGGGRGGSDVEKKQVHMCILEIQKEFAQFLDDLPSGALC